MTFPPSPPSRRRRKGWAVVCLVLLAILGGAWFLLPDPPEVEMSRAINLGMNRNEVRTTLGVELAGYGSGVLYGQLQTQILKLRQLLPATWRWKVNYDAWPVHIRFDKQDRVDRIKRGREIVER
jgi:hypothetical protein